MLSTKKEVREEARQRINELLEKYDDSPSKVGRLLKVNRGLIARVRDGGYSEYVVMALGLPIIKTEEVEICLDCGHIHPQKKTCANVLKKTYRKRRRKAADLDPTKHGELQSIALDEIAEEYGYDTWTDFCQGIADVRIKTWEVTGEIASKATR